MSGTMTDTMKGIPMVVNIIKMNNNMIIMGINKVIPVVVFALLFVSCGNKNTTPGKESSRVKYENEVFSISLPEGWVYNDSLWGGLLSMQNEVDFSNPKSDLVWLHCVKSFLPIKYKDIQEAKEMAKLGLAMRSYSGENVELLAEEDSIIIAGDYPASILYIGCYADNDTIIQKQIITMTKTSHMLLYFNEIFNIKNMYEAMDIGDAIIGTLKIKEAENPLDDDEVLKKVAEEGLDNNVVDQKYIDAAGKLLDDTPD